jgi:outer membrane receptor protein involved in Fe transport
MQSQNRRLFKKKSLATAVAAATFLTGYPLVVSAGAVLEEITVTATRRAQSVQDIPYNISAISGSEIEEGNIIDAQELLRAMPGVSVPDGGARLAENNNGITIRGLNVNPAATDRAFLSDPTVSIYVGDTPIFANFILKDIERVEVMRGPQGTLYGSGSLGGTVRYILNKPSTDGVSGNVEASYGKTEGSDGNNFFMGGTINIPMGDKFALRASVGKIDNDGVIDYVNAYATDSAGKPIAEGGDIEFGDPVYVNKKDADTVEIDYYRVALLFSPSDKFQAVLTYMNQQGDYGGRRQQTSGPDGYGNFYDDYEIGSVVLEPAETEAEFTSLEIEYDLGFATLSSSTSQYDRSYDGTSENTGFTAAQGWLVYYGYGHWPRPAFAAERQNQEDAFIQEFRLVSNGENTIDWVAGLYYMDQEGSSAQQTQLPGFTEWHLTADPDRDGFNGGGFYVGGFYGDINSPQSFAWTYEKEFTDKAAFGEITYHMNDSLDLTLGARYFDNENTVTSQTSFPVWGLSNPVVKETVSDSDTLFKGNISWTMSDTHMVYGTISEGYRRGGTNAAPVYPDPSYPNDPAWGSFDSDSVTNYEIGIKGQKENLTYTAALFFVDWEDPQLNVSTPSGAYYAVANGSKAETKGLETEFNWAVTDSIRLFGGYTYLNAELTEDLFLHDANPATDGATELRATKGAELPGTAEHTVNLAATHTMSLSDGFDLISRIDGYYQSEVENSILNIDPNWDETLDGFALWNVSFSLVSEKWTVALYGKNILNEEGTTATYKEEYMTSDPANNYYGTGQKDFITNPRTITIGGTYRF